VNGYDTHPFGSFAEEINLYMSTLTCESQAIAKNVVQCPTHKFPMSYHAKCFTLTDDNGLPKFNSFKAGIGARLINR
jgi:hypothetical protein